MMTVIMNLREEKDHKTLVIRDDNVYIATKQRNSEKSKKYKGYFDKMA